MDVDGKRIVVTGGASGIGEGLCRRFKDCGAADIVVADIDMDGAERVAAEVGGSAVECDVGSEEQIVSLVATAAERMGRIDMFCSNAGYAAGAGLDTPTARMLDMFNVHVMAHVWAAREVVPSMLEHGGGYLLNTISAAGLISGPTPMPYVTTKHAAFGFAEWCGINLKHKGIGISTLCPTAVDTPGLLRPDPPPGAAPPQDADPLLTVDQCMDAVMDGLAAETFIILPKPMVAQMWAARGNDYDAWITEMAVTFGGAPAPAQAAP